MRVSARKTQIFIAGLLVLMLAVIVFVQAAFDLNPLVNYSSPDQIVLLYTVSTLVFLVLIVFGFILLRTLVKIWAERREKKPGSRFKTSLVTTLIALTLVPAALLFMFGMGLVNRNIDKWFSVQVDTVFQATHELGQQWALNHEMMARGILAHMGMTSPRISITRRPRSASRPWCY